jgi:uncharacterized protein (TIGR00730 family)
MSLPPETQGSAADSSSNQPKPTQISEVTPAPALKEQNRRNHLEIRQRLIDAAEGRLVGVIEEFEKTFDILAKYEQTVSVFGSARLAQDHPACQQAYNLGKELARRGYALVTGGGHGIMEAVNHGAFDVGGVSIGLNIKLPTEQTLNEYTTEHYTFQHFFGRKVSLTLDASGYIFCAGGFGTLDELFEITTLEQTAVVPRAPIILLGKDFWKPMEHYIVESLSEKYATISPEDPSLHLITDDIQEAISLIEAYKILAAKANSA